MENSVLKTGNGLLRGVSSNIDQPGKTLVLFDDTTTLCRIPLDKVLTHIETLPDGTEVIVPGLPLDLIFMTNLRVETDGKELDIYWK